MAAAAHRPATPQRPDTEPGRAQLPPLRRSGRLAVELIVAALLLLAALFVAARSTLPSDSTATAPTARGVDGARIVTIQPRSTGLRDGDVVVAVNGRDLATRALPLSHVGERLIYRVRRHGQLFDVPVTVGRYPLGAALARNWATLVVVTSIFAVAGYVFARRPDDHAARVLLVLAALAVCGSTSWIAALQVIDLSGGPGWWAYLGSGTAYALLWASMLHFVLVFAGPPASVTRRRQLAATIYAVPAALCAASVIAALQPTSALSRLGVLSATLTGTEYVVPVLLMAALAATYRRVEHSQRLRLQPVMGWIAVSAILDLALWSLPTWLLGHPLLPDPIHPLVFLPCPLAFAAAVLRRKLFDIEVVIRRSIVFASLTACVVTIYVLVVGTLSRLFQNGHGWAPLVATGVVAVVFAPLHQHLRRRVIHLVYGYRDDPFSIIARLGRQLEELPSPDDVLPLVVDTLAAALRLPYAAIELSYPDGVDQAASHGELRGTPLSLPLVFRGEPLGRLVVGQRSAREAFSRAESRLFADLASQAGVAAHAVRLTRDLQRSRERLVTAAEEERRRLRRDLHDGVAPTMAAAALELQAVGRLATTDPSTARELAGRVRDELNAAVADIRHLVDDLRPAALDQLGLIAALRERAHSLTTPDDPGGLKVTVEADGDFDDLPAAVEVAAFHIASEALHNASRHAAASTCSLHLTLREALDIEIADNGRGLPVHARDGIGLASMRERAAELGGTCTMGNNPTGGTIVRAHLPLHPR